MYHSTNLAARLIQRGSKLPFLNFLLPLKQGCQTEPIGHIWPMMTSDPAHGLLDQPHVPAPASSAPCHMKTQPGAAHLPHSTGAQHGHATCSALNQLSVGFEASPDQALPKPAWKAGMERHRMQCITLYQPWRTQEALEPACAACGTWPGTSATGAAQAVSHGLTCRLAQQPVSQMGLTALA